MSKDFYNNDDDDNQSYQKIVAMCVAAASLVVLLFLVMLYMNSQKDKKKEARVEINQNVENEDFLENSHNFTSDELDFWDKNADKDYEDEPDGESTPYKKGNVDDVLEDNSSDNDNPNIDPSDKTSYSEEDSDEVPAFNTDGKKPQNMGGEDDRPEDVKSVNSYDDDPSLNDDKHIKVIDDKGKARYYELLDGVPKNDYNLKDYLTRQNGILAYKDSKREAQKGIDLSKYNGTIDFKKVSDAGVSFAMLRVGSRGYESGLVTLDDKFIEYATNCQLNNIALGAYFYSQAITEAEAIEEANYTVGAASSFIIKYPLAIFIDSQVEDIARGDNLTVEERTKIVKAFCDTVKAFGFKPAVYTDRNMLITGLDLEELSGVDVWLKDSNVPTDYPYRYSIWQYATTGRVDGINGDVDMDLCFVNFEQR